MADASRTLAGGTGAGTAGFSLRVIVAPTAVARERYRGLLMGDIKALAVAHNASSRCAPASRRCASGRTVPQRAHFAQALRLAAAALRSSKSALRAYYRRLCARMAKGKAVTAAAHKPARLAFAMLTKGEEYTDAGQDYFEEGYRERVLRNLTKRAKKLGMQIVPVPHPV